MIQYIFGLSVIICCMIALSNWRSGILLTIPIDALRDPVRKLTLSEPVWITHIGLLLWACVIIGSLGQDRGLRKRLQATFPRLRTGVILTCVAVMPAAFLSLLLYRNGWILVLIGGTSYLAPLTGVYLGIKYAKNPRDIRRYLAAYAVVNSVMFLGNIAEFAGLGWPALGGLSGFVWVRQQTGVWVDMVSGFYRSPDIAGFHAATVAIFTVILALPKHKRGSPIVPWIGLTVFSMFVLFLSGRRKTIGMPFAWLAGWLILSSLRDRGSAKRAVAVVLMAAIAVSVGAWFLVSGEERLTDHGIYVASTANDILPKLYNETISGSITTIQQSGILGSGLGVATQGSHYVREKNLKAWQEDGTSRLFKELGVIGTLLIIMALLLFAIELRRAYKIPIFDQTRKTLQDASLAFVAANLGCFVASHQIYSGDPMTAMIPLVFLGSVYGHSLAN